MYLRIPAGTTSKLIEFPVYDSSSTIGALLAGLTYNSSGMTAYYDLWGASGSATSMSLVTMTKGTWTSLGFVAVDATNMPGMYQLGIPNAALTGATGVTIYLKGATNMVPVVLVIELTSATDYPANVQQLLGTAWLTPGTAGTPDVNVKLIGGQTAGLDGNNLLKVDVVDWNGTAVSSPATAGIPDINVKNMNNVAATSITTINANQGSTQPLNFTGTGGSALVKVDVTDIATAAVATGSAQLGVNLVNIAGSAVATGTAQLGVNVVNIGAHAVTLDANNLLEVDVQDWKGAAAPAMTGDAYSIVSNGTYGNSALETLLAALPSDASIQTDVYTVLSGTAIADATSLTANSLLDRLRALGWIIRNQIAITDATGSGTIYKDDSATTAFSVSLTDNATTTTRTRAA